MCFISALRLVRGVLRDEDSRIRLESWHSTALTQIAVKMSTEILHESPFSLQCENKKLSLNYQKRFKSGLTAEWQMYAKFKTTLNS